MAGKKTWEVDDCFPCHAQSKENGDDPCSNNLLTLTNTDS